MNIREKVRFCVDEAMNVATGYGQGQESVESERAALERASDRIIALVTSARDAEIREAAMKPETLEAVAEAIQDSEFGEGSWESLTTDEGAYEKAATIDIAGDGITALLTALLNPNPNGGSNE